MGTEDTAESSYQGDVPGPGYGEEGGGPPGGAASVSVPEGSSGSPSSPVAPSNTSDAEEVKDYLAETNLEEVMVVLLDIHDDNNTNTYFEQVVHDCLVAWAKSRKGLQATKLARKYPGFKPDLARIQKTSSAGRAARSGIWLGPALRNRRPDSSRGRGRAKAPPLTSWRSTSSRRPSCTRSRSRTTGDDR